MFVVVFSTNTAPGPGLSAMLVTGHYHWAGGRS